MTEPFATWQETGVPLREWVNGGVDFLKSEYRGVLKAISVSVKDFVEGIEVLLLDPNPVMLATLALLTFLAVGWLGGKFSRLARAHEQDPADSGPLWASGVYAGVGIVTGAVLAFNLVLNLLMDVGVGQGLAASLAPWYLVESFSLVGSAIYLLAVTAASKSGFFSVLKGGWSRGRYLPLAGGALGAAAAGYAAVFIVWTFLAAPPVGPVWVVLGAIVAVALFARGWALALFTFLALALIQNIDLWNESMETLALVLASGIVCGAIGLPLGITMSRSERMTSVVRPALDFMQTMPAFVYLIPGIAFFGIGVVPALVGTVIFALPPVVRLTAHGIHEVETEVVEASDSFGATAWQTLVKVQLPLARPSIMVGVNQTLLLSLSMVVIAALVGAGGLGRVVVNGLTRVDPGMGFEGGISIVILAVILDRITQGLGGGAVAAGTRTSVMESFRRTLRQLMGRPADAPAK